MDAGTTWAGTHTYAARGLAVPTTLEQAQQIVADADRIRALGSRHSFNDLADSPGELISLVEVAVDIEVDAAAGVAVVPGAATYGAVAPVLAEAGVGLPALASLPHISVAGAISTGTHGSGDRTRCLAGAVRGLEFIGADGQLRWVRRGDADFDGSVVSLGALGIISRVELDVEPTFQVRQDVVNAVPWDVVLGRFDEVTSAAYSVSVFTRWEAEAVDQVWFKSKVGAGTEVGLAERFGGVAASGDQHPILGLDAVNATAQLGVAGPWFDRLPHFRMGFTPSNGTEIQSEYLVPRQLAVAAIEALRGIAEQVRPLLQVTEIRTIAADELWLSSAGGRDAVGLHFTLAREPEAVRALLPVIEQTLAPFAARPHWGKWFTMGRQELANRYDRLADFAALAARVDPAGKFRNGYLDGLVLQG